MRVLVAGGAGFVGSHLVDRLLEREATVVVVDNCLTGRYVNLRRHEDHPLLSIAYQDITRPLTHVALLERFDWVVNLASPASPKGYARYPVETQLVNSIGVFHLLELARRDGARFLQASTSEVYGDPLVHPQVEGYWGNVNPNGPRSCYDEGKRFAESLTMEFHRQYGLDVRIVRIFNTYGPRSNPRDGRVVPNFCVQGLRGEPITIYGDGSQTRSFCYVDDLVRGLLRFLEVDGLGGEVINLGNPTERTVRELAERVIALTGGRSTIDYLGLPIDDPTRRRPDVTKAKRLLDWEPTVDLDEGLAATIDYFARSLGPVDDWRAAPPLAAVPPLEATLGA